MLCFDKLNDISFLGVVVFPLLEQVTGSETKDRGMQYMVSITGKALLLSSTATPCLSMCACSLYDKHAYIYRLTIRN